MTGRYDTASHSPRQQFVPRVIFLYWKEVGRGIGDVAEGKTVRKARQILPTYRHPGVLYSRLVTAITSIRPSSRMVTVDMGS